jgi:hypothetical protein
VACSESEMTLQIDKASKVITDPLSRKSQFKSSERLRTDFVSSPRYLLKVVRQFSYIKYSLPRTLNAHASNLIQGDKHSPSLWRRATSHCGLPYTLKQQIHRNPRLTTEYQQRHGKTPTWRRQSPQETVNDSHRFADLYTWGKHIRFFIE